MSVFGLNFQLGNTELGHFFLVDIFCSLRSHFKVMDIKYYILYIKSLIYLFIYVCVCIVGSNIIAVSDNEF